MKDIYNLNFSIQGGEANIFLVGLVYLKKRDKSKFSWLALLFKHFKKNNFQIIIRKLSERNYDLVNAETE